jgi:hypothetical protein
MNIQDDIVVAVIQEVTRALVRQSTREVHSLYAGTAPCIVSYVLRQTLNHHVHLAQVVGQWRKHATRTIISSAEGLVSNRASEHVIPHLEQTHTIASYHIVLLAINLLNRAPTGS